MRKFFHINLNDEVGVDLYSVEADGDGDNWLDSFSTFDEAMDFINGLGGEMVGYRDTRWKGDL